MLKEVRHLAPVAALVLTLALVTPSDAQPQGTAISVSDLSAFHPRPIGPAVTGGRVHDVEALPGNASVLFVASASGGLWKSTNRGHTWRNVFDTMAVSTFGDVDISRSDPAIIYAGTGEQQNRQSSSWGNGVYRSDDQGESWIHVGLEETRHIGRVRIHPRNPDVVFVAALGNLWASSPNRGVYRTTDGGRNWERVLYIDEFTGAVDIVIDPRNPRVVYAATYQRLRRTWGFNGGGPGSGIYRSRDGGDSWEELTHGIPSGDKGRIGIALAESNPRVLMALIEHESESGTYRSEDGGVSWDKVNDLNPRPMYYSHILIDPTDDQRVYLLSTTSYTSEDGGRSFVEIAKRPTYDVGVHADHHTMWIDPGDPSHFFLAGDAGLHETYDRGVNFRRINNFPIAQAYAIGVDMRDPYYVYIGLQDNHSFMGPSRTRSWDGIMNDDWRQTGFGDGMFQQPDPTNPRYVYAAAQGGSIYRLDALTGDLLDLEPLAPEGEEYRFDWAAPILLSPHDPGTVYLGGNRLFISHDRGLTWSRTQDLSRATDREGLELMGVAGRDISLSKNDGTSSYGEIVTIAQSPIDPSILWVGTDDGNLQLSTDGGSSWQELSGNVPGVPEGTYVSRVIASVQAPGVAYATFDAHRDGDFAPYVFRTEDLGQSWTPLMSSLPTGSVNVIVEHPDNHNTLFLGTEHHLFASTNRGADWAALPNLPTTIYEDLKIHPREKDLVIGTHGRGIWILDDTRPLAAWDSSIGQAQVHLFEARPTPIFLYRKDTSYRAQAEFAGVNPVDGMNVTYRLGKGGGDALMTVTNDRGRVVRTLSVPDGEGLHRINWDLRHGDDTGERWSAHDTSVTTRPTRSSGPLVSPGRFTLTLEARGESTSVTVDVLPDPEMPVTLAQYREREAFLLRAAALRRRLPSVTECSAVPEGPGSSVGDRRDRLRCEMDRLYSSLTGRGAVQGSLYPPTQAHQEALERAEATMAEISQERGSNR